MTLEKLDRKDLRLIVLCAVVSAVSLAVGIKYYFRAFPEASIEFRLTKESSTPLAESFLSRMGLDPSGYRHAAVFGFDEEAKTFLEREVGVSESNNLLDTTVRLWRWRHRWFRPLQKEEMEVEVTTRGEPVGFRHLFPEEAKGADLTPEEARVVAEKFLVESMERPLDGLSFVEGSQEKRPNRTDHKFTWKVKGSEVRSADYRIEVGVAGAGVAGYGEYLKVPDTWVRDYAKLRSKNDITGQIDGVLLLLTAVAMLVVLALRIRRVDVRWKAAVILGLATFLLQSISQLNTLPSDLYGYKTTTSFGAFLVTKILAALASGLVAGGIVSLIAAAAEPLYRERFPKRLSLTSFLRLRALGTKEFFIASMAGITLTFFFFAYENIFYLIANSLGAWAPREVAYSDLLSTAFPWVYVLFFGWLPAISEEGISRMFSIPFFEKLFRSRTAAIVIAAFIWGFGHAAYPNQPFWIRGLEVGLAGIVFGLVMLRFGIASVVICHFSVDALYTAFVLIRSPDIYYKVTGTLSAGIFALLLLVAALLYLRRGGFLLPEVTNEAEGVAPPVPPRIVPVGAPPIIGYQPLGPRTIAAGLGTAAVLIALSVLPIASFGDWAQVKATRDEAREAAASFLREADFDVLRYKSAVVPLDRTDATAAAYLQEAGGLDAASRFYSELVPTPLWRVRFFVPGQHEEYSVSVEATTPRVVGFSRVLPEDAAGASLSKAEAQEVAEKFLTAHGLDPKSGELKEQSQKDEKARRDHTLVWEFSTPGAGEAKVRLNVGIQGNAVGIWTREVKIPEEWRRGRERETARTAILRWLKLPYILLFVGFGVALLVGKIRGGEIPWRFAFFVGGAAAAVMLLRLLIALDRLWDRYQTSMPGGAYTLVIGIILFITIVFFFLAGTIVGALAGAVHPAATTMFSRASGRTYGRDALIAGLVSLGLLRGLPALVHILEGMLPAGRLIQGVSWPASVAVQVPFLGAAGDSIFATIFVAGLGGTVASLFLTFFKSRIVRVLLGIGFVVSFLPPAARTMPEYGLSALSLLLVGAGILLLVRWFLRDNPLAWLWSVYFALATSAAVRLMGEPATPYLLHGGLILLTVAVPAVWLLRDALGRPGPEAAKSP